MKLKDKVVILTGASSGIGEATALRFAEEGAKVIIVARSEDKLNAISDKAKEFPGEVIAIAGDVSKQEDVEKLVNKTIDTYGRIDVLVNNAGVLDNYLSADNMTDEIWDRVFDINVTGPMRLIREVLKHMVKENKGNIINTASVGGLYGGRGGMAYVASKHALVGMTKHIGFMFQDKGIRCNAVAPGSIATEIGNKVKESNMDVLNKLMKGFELYPETGEPQEIANVMLFLASDDSSFVNGTTIVADGGWTAF